MAFREVEIEIVDEITGNSLIKEYDKIRELYEKHGDTHGQTIVAQIFAHTDSRVKYFLSGRVLTEEESDKFQTILKS